MPRKAADRAAFKVRKPRANRVLAQTLIERDIYRAQRDQAQERARIAEEATVVLQQQIAAKKIETDKHAAYQRQVLAELKDLKNQRDVRYEAQQALIVEGQDKIRELSAQLSLLQPPLNQINTVQFKQQWPPRPPEKPAQVGQTLVNGLDGLVDLLAVLERMTPERRYRLLAMVDAYFYDPPAKAAR